MLYLLFLYLNISIKQEIYIEIIKGRGQNSLRSPLIEGLSFRGVFRNQIGGGDNRGGAILVMRGTFCPPPQKKKKILKCLNMDIIFFAFPPLFSILFHPFPIFFHLFPFSSLLFFPFFFPSFKILEWGNCPSKSGFGALAPFN